MLSSLFLTLTACVLGYAVVPETLSVDTLSDFITGHNQLRSSLSLPPLEWNSTLTASAQYHASQCLATGSLPKSGVNLFWSSPKSTDNRLLAAAAIQSWASDVQYVQDPAWSCFVDGKSKRPNCKYYSQLVWKNTTSVGCAIVHCDPIERQNVVVCEYNPPGNIIGEIPY